MDLRSAELAEGARLSVHALFGGIAITTPATWRIESTARGIGGGIAVHAPAAEDADAPLLTLAGTALFGGIDVRSGERRRGAGVEKAP